MGAKQLIDGQSRRLLFTNINSLYTQGGSVDFGAYEVRGYSRFAGVIQTNSGGLTFRYRMGATSGAYQVTSTFTVSSGGNVFDVLNYGQFADFSFTVGSTTNYWIGVYGEPIR